MHAHLRHGFALCALACAANAVRPTSAAGQQTGAIAGRVVDSLASGVAGATVTLDTPGFATTTDSAGQFRLSAVPAGKHMVSVRAIGVIPMTMGVDVSAGGTATAVFTVVRVGQHAAALPTVSTTEASATGKPARLAYTMKYDGFYERRAANGAGGYFFTHEDLEHMKKSDLSDMLREVPGLRLRNDIDRNEITFPGCGTDHILVMLDNEKVWPTGDSSSPGLGTVASAAAIMNGHSTSSSSTQRGPDPLEVLETLHIQNVEAIEVYKNMSALPVFAAGEYCGAIVIWTR